MNILDLAKSFKDTLFQGAQDAVNVVGNTAHQAIDSYVQAKQPQWNAMSQPDFWKPQPVQFTPLAKQTAQTVLNIKPIHAIAANLDPHNFDTPVLGGIRRFNYNNDPSPQKSMDESYGHMFMRSNFVKGLEAAGKKDQTPEERELAMNAVLSVGPGNMDFKSTVAPTLQSPAIQDAIKNLNKGASNSVKKIFAKKLAQSQTSGDVRGVLSLLQPYMRPEVSQVVNTFLTQVADTQGGKIATGAQIAEKAGKQVPKSAEVQNLIGDINAQPAPVKTIKNLGAEVQGLLDGINNQSGKIKLNAKVTTPKIPSTAQEDIEKLAIESSPQISKASRSSEYLKTLIAQQKEAAGGSAGGNLVATGKHLIDEVKRKLVDSAAPIEDILAQVKKTGVEVTPKGDISNQIDRAIRARELAGQFLKDNGLVEAIRKVPDIHTLDQYLIAKHAQDVKTVTGRNAAADKQLVQDLAPEYEPYAQQVVQYGQKLLDYATQAGLVAQNTATMLKKQYPNYVPLNRVFTELEKGAVPEGVKKGIAGLSRQTVVQKLKGSERAIVNPTESLLTKTLDAFEQGERNISGKLLASYQKFEGNPFSLRELKPNETATHTFSYLENGVKRTFETTPEIANAAKLLDKRQLGLVGQIFSYPTRVARIGITGINLPFIATNVVKDQMSAAINSSKALQTSIANPAVFMKALWSAIGHGQEYDDWIRSAGGGTSFDISRSAPKMTIDQIRAGRSIPSNILYKVTHPDELLRVVENVVNKGEEVTRLQQFIGTKEALLKEGKSVEDATILAAKAARENTVNFARSGDWGKALNAALLYLNANIQGARTLVRTATQRPVQTAAKIGLTVFTPLTAITTWNLSDPDRKAAYDDIQQFEKDNNLIIVPPNPTKDENGKWNVIKIPLSQEVASLTVPVRKQLEALAGGDAPGFGDLAKALIGSGTGLQVGSPREIVNQFTPQGIKPSLEGVLNKNLFTGQDVVPQYIDGKETKNLSPEQQVRQNTSGTARKIGGVVGVSPLKVEQFIRSSSGGVGSQLLHASDQALNTVGAIPDNQIGGQSVIEGITSRFQKAAGGDDLSRLFSAVDDANNDGKTLDLNQQVVQNGKVYYPTKVKHKDGSTSYSIKSDKTNAQSTSNSPTYTKSSDSPQSLIGKAGLYVSGAFNDPKATLNAVTSGQPIRKISGSTVILERQNGLASLDNGDQATQVDHKIALALGGTNDPSNLQVLSATDNAAKGIVETHLAKLLVSKQITKEEAQKRDLNWRDEIKNLPASTQNKIISSVNKVATVSDPSQQFQIVDQETGSRKVIDLTPIPEPTLTGNDVIDKRLKSLFKTSVTKQVNNIVTLYQDGQLTLEDAQKRIEALQAQSSKVSPAKGKKPKKVTVKFSKAKTFKPMKLKLSKTPTFKIKKTKALKLTNVKKAKSISYKVKGFKNSFA